ncbi:hypothetical protein [Nonomuraea sp. CA-141351]|uniref:hypothetical protein n=1 Tax=Nonomuraea sp. CA-141351 TaxID=3239996 RepID=UPI003D8CEA78
MAAADKSREDPDIGPTGPTAAPVWPSAELYGQHTQAAGQEFAKDAVDRAFELTQGQPWLVNALAHVIIVEPRRSAALHQF